MTYILGSNAEQWIELIEWLVYRGAKEIFVITINGSITDYIRRHIELLTKYYNANIKLITSNLRDLSKNGVSKVLLSCKQLYQIAAIFLLPVFDVDDTLNLNFKLKQIIEKTTRKISVDILFVCLLMKSINWSVGLYSNRRTRSFFVDENTEHSSLNNILQILGIIIFKIRSSSMSKPNSSNC